MITYCGTKPASPNPGDVFFDTTAGDTMAWNGTCWLRLNSMPPANPLKDFAAVHGIPRSLSWAEEMQGIEAAAEENEIVRVLLQRLRTAVKLVRE